MEYKKIKKLSILGPILMTPMVATLVVACSSEKDLITIHNVEEEIKEQIETKTQKEFKFYKSLAKDEEGFPIHLETELIKGEGNLSVGRVAKHLQKYLKVKKEHNGWKQTYFFMQFGPDNLWRDDFFDDLDPKTKKSALWNLGNPSKKWKTETTSCRNEKLTEEQLKECERTPLNEFVYRKADTRLKTYKQISRKIGWKRFFDKNTKEYNLKTKRFNVYLSVYPLPIMDSDKKYKAKVEMIISDNIYKKEIDDNSFLKKKIYLKKITLGYVEAKTKFSSEIKETFRQVYSKKNTLPAKDETRVKEAIRNLADLNNLKKFIKIIPKQVLDRDIILDLIKKILSKEKNSEIVEKNMNEIVNLFTKSPFIDVNNPISLPTKEYFNKKNIDFQEFITKNKTTFLYNVITLANYIEQKIKEQEKQS